MIKFPEDVKINHKIYHNSGTKVKSLGSTVMWFALNLTDANGWYDNMVDDADESFLYECTLKSGLKIADYKTFDHDINDLEVVLVGNPTHEEVMNLEGVQTLIQKDYAGLVFSDYDPNDSQQDSDSLILFNPRDSISNFKQIR